MDYSAKQQYSALPVYLLLSWEFLEYICHVKFRKTGQMIEILSLRSSQKHSQEEQSTEHYSERQLLNIS